MHYLAPAFIIPIGKCIEARIICPRMTRKGQRDCVDGSGIRTATLLAEPQPLTQELLAKAIKTDSLTIPTPGELFAALEKPGKPDWAAQYRTPIP